MTLLAKGRVLARAWSVRLAALGALIFGGLLSIEPATLQSAWQTMPADLRALIPAHVQSWIGLVLFVLVVVARGVPQPKVDAGLAAIAASVAGGRLGLTSAAITAPEPAWIIAARAAVTRAITSIVIHCSATPEGRDVKAATIRSWHLAKNWSDIGYHFVIDLDGTIEVGRPLAQAGAHVAGYNARSIGICYVGGITADGKLAPKDTRTPAQRAAMLQLLRALKRRWPNAEIKGHRDFPDVAKACPSFDARAEYAKIAL